MALIILGGTPPPCHCRGRAQSKSCLNNAMQSSGTETVNFIFSFQPVSVLSSELCLCDRKRLQPTPLTLTLNMNQLDGVYRIKRPLCMALLHLTVCIPRACLSCWIRRAALRREEPSSLSLFSCSLSTCVTISVSSSFFANSSFF